MEKNHVFFPFWNRNHGMSDDKAKPTNISYMNY